MSHYTLRSGVATATSSAYCPVCTQRTYNLCFVIGKVQTRLPVNILPGTLCCSVECFRTYMGKLTTLHSHLPLSVQDYVAWYGELASSVAKGLQVQ